MDGYIRIIIIIIIMKYGGIIRVRRGRGRSVRLGIHGFSELKTRSRVIRAPAT